jgi:hypothetical protein
MQQAARLCRYSIRFVVEILCLEAGFSLSVRADVAYHRGEGRVDLQLRYFYEFKKVVGSRWLCIALERVSSGA